MLLRPIAFRVFNYKSIADSGLCTLSGDGITVIAGQNEAGKTSILQALKDFDGGPGKPPKLDDVIPDQNPTLIPSVLVQFQFAWAELIEKLTLEKYALEGPIASSLQSGTISLTRNLITGTFTLDEIVEKAFEEVVSAYETDQDTYPDPEEEYGKDFVYASQSDFIDVLYREWPSFVYFDSFDDLLPRRVPVDVVTKLVGVISTVTEPDIPAAAKNFLKVAKVSLEEVRRLAALEDDEKQLKNYLETQSKLVSSDFLEYWKQKLGNQQQVKLKISYSHRADGSYLLFYAEDNGTYHFPSQRSKGFLWFLSFYISLTSAAKADASRKQLILVDEPGSFLHPKAQHDILDILEKRIVRDGNMVVYSTHSPYLLPSDRLDRVRIAFKHTDNTTVIADRLNDERLRGELRGDALAPIWDAIGIEIGDLDAGAVATERELLIVEGVSDYYYLQSWCKLLSSSLLDHRRILIANGTPMVPYSVSLAIAYSTQFAVLLDHDDAGNAAAEKLKKEMDINPAIIVRPQNAAGLEDLFSVADFNSLLAAFGHPSKIETSIRPAAYMKKGRVDKILIARKFSELVGSGAITSDGLEESTRNAVSALLTALAVSFEEKPLAG